MTATIASAAVRQISAAVLAIGLFSAQTSAQTSQAAVGPLRITRGEMALLPEYCADSQTFGYGDAYFNTSPRAGHWISLMGKTFWAVHHYCWALIRMHRSRAPGLNDVMREGTIKGAIGDYVYVLENLEPGFVLLPEVLTKLGEAYLELGAFGDAEHAFKQARANKPDYWPPYVRWAEFLASRGKHQEAIAHVEVVLKLAPDDAELKRQFARLQNKGAAPKVVRRPAAEPRAASRSAAASNPASPPR